MLERSASRLTSKYHQPYSRMCGYAKTMVVITLEKENWHYIHVSQLTKINITVQCPRWKDGGGLNLY